MQYSNPTIEVFYFVENSGNCVTEINDVFNNILIYWLDQYKQRVISSRIKIKMFFTNNNGHIQTKKL